MKYLYETDNLKFFQAASEPTELPKIINIHIEEPELSLFPDAQCRMIDNLIYTATQTKDRKLSIMIATHSPYILNYLNIVLNQTKEGRAKLSNENVAAYRLYEGKLQNLLEQNEKGHWIVDSYDLSEIMGDIYNEFVELDDI
jgi:predicted ATPase